MRKAVLASIFVILLLGFQSGPFAAQASSTNLTYGVTNSIGQVDMSNVPDASGTSQNPHEQESVHEVDSQHFAQEKGRAESPGFVPPGEATKVITNTSGAAPLTVSSSLTLEGAPGGPPNPCACSPPDPNLGVGPNHVFEMVNLAGIIYDKSGNLVKGTFDLSSFFQLSGSMSDPQILFDALSGRWFASIIDITNGRVQFAVSATNDPMGTWKLYYVSASGSSLPDQPFIGTSDDKFVIAANIFNHRGTLYFGVEYWVLNKAQLVSGASSVNFASNGPDPSMFTLRPARHLTSSSVFYMITNCLSACVSDPASTTSSAELITVSGVPPGAVTINQNTFSIATSSTPPNAVQPGTSTLLTTNDNRILSASWELNTLWFSWTDACVPAGDSVTRSCARLIQVTTSGTGPPTKVQDFDYSASGQYFFYPAVSLSQGQLVVSYGESSSTVFPSLLVTGRAPTDPVNTLQTPVTIRNGTAPDTSTRYGDYFGAATDPTPVLSGLVGYWPLDEGTGALANDLSGSGNTGTLVNSPTWQSGTNCKYGNCLSFASASSQYITSGSTKIPTAAAARTIITWIYPFDRAGTYFPFSYGASASAQSFMVYLDGNGVLTFAGYNDDCAASQTIPMNTWSQIGASYPGSGTVVTLIVNGATASCNIGSPLNTASSNFDIARRHDTASNYFNGRVDEVRIYDHALSPSDISILYVNGPSPTFWVAGEYRASSGFQSWNTAIASVAALDSLSKGLVGYWPLDEGTGALANDLSGSGNTGTLVNSPTWQSGTNCKYGNCLSFASASSQYVTTSSSRIPTGASARTITLWVYPLDRAGTYFPVSYGVSVNNQMFTLYIDPRGALTFAGYNDDCSASQIVPMNQWSQIGVSYSGGTTITLVLNGATASCTISNPLNTASTNFDMARRHDAGCCYLNGREDDVRIYDHALSPSEISMLYNLGRI